MKRLLESIRKRIKENKRGNIEPIIITQDMVIVSGHQRVRAAKELGLSTIMVDIRKYENDNKVLKDLIETNIRQRGIGNPNPVKLGKCFQFLNDWYGFERGAKIFQGNQYKEVNEKFFHSPDSSDNPSTQKELAQDYGITQQTMNNYMRLAKAIPELEDACRDDCTK